MLPRDEILSRTPSLEGFVGRTAQDAQAEYSAKHKCWRLGGVGRAASLEINQSLPTICPIMLVLSFDVVGDASVGEGKDASSAGLRAGAHNRVPEGADRHAIVHRP